MAVQNYKYLSNQSNKIDVEPEFNEKQAEEWMMGQDLNITTGKKGFFVIKFKEDFLGTGKISENKISNFIPKSRRLKFKESSLPILS